MTASPHQNHIESVLRRALSRRGVTILPRRDDPEEPFTWIEFEDPAGGRRAVRVCVWLSRTEDGRPRGQVEIGVTLRDGRIARAGFSWADETEEATVRWLKDRFLLAAVDPMLCGLLGRPVDDQVGLESWSFDRAGEWLAIFGHITTIVYEPSDEEPDPTDAYLAMPPDLLPAVRRRAEERIASDPHHSVHWISIEHRCTASGGSADEDGDDSAYVLFDGEVWPEGAGALADVSWIRPPGNGLYVRDLFIVLQRAGSSATTTRADWRTTAAAVRELAALAASVPEASDDALVTALVRRGIDASLARRVCVFAPIALVQTLVDGPEYPETYELDGRSLRLAQEPAFDAARDAYWTGALYPEACEAVACRSAWVPVIHRTVDAGEPLTGLRFPPPRIELDELRPDAGKHRATKRKRPWWRPW